MLFSRANLMVGQVASKSAMDAALNCIHMEKDGSTVGANGKVFMAVGPVDEKKVHFPEVGQRDTPPERGLSIPLDLLDKAIKNLPKDKRPSLQHVAMTKSRDPKKVELTTSDMRSEQRVAGYPRPEPFSDWKTAIRKVRSQGGPKICLNRRDLIDLLQAMEEACPDKGGENPVYIEINPEGKGLIMRCVNRETGQRAIGGMYAYQTGGHWLPCDGWEMRVFQTAVKRLKA